jgi:sulfur-oxidizing protein SoxZ
MSKIRLLAKTKNGITQIKVLIKHPMRGTKKGDSTPADYLREIKCTHNDKVVISALIGTGISKNPYFSFKFKGGNKGDQITLIWTDNQGKTGSKNTKIR